MFTYKEHQGNVGTVEKVIVKVGDEQASIGDGVNIYTVVDNMFVQNPSNVVTALYNSLKDIYYYPVSNMEWSGDFSLDMSDKVTVFGKATYILNRTIKVAGGLTETMNSPVKSNVERDSTGKNNTQLEINRVKTEIKIISGEIDQMISDTEGNFTQINQDIDSISNRVGTAEGDIAALELTAQGLALDVSAADGKALNAQATADAVTLAFYGQKFGGKNLLQNSGFVNNLDNWNLFTNTYGTIAVQTSSALPSGKFLEVPMSTGLSNTIRQIVATGFDNRNKTWNISGYVRNTASAAGPTNPYAGIQIRVTYADASQEFLAAIDHTQYGYFWRKFNYSFTTDTSKEVSTISVDVYGRDMSGGAFYVSSLVLEEGNVAHAWQNADNEGYSTYHTFTKDGYSIKDNNGETLLTPNGMANEQNIVLVDNVEDGYPMRIPFHIGSEVSQITQAKLKWKNYPFRTYSKGSASGGGSTSGPSSRTTTDATWESSGIAESTSSVTAGTLPHQHTIALSKLSHSHGMAHTHTTPDHEHPPKFGILEEVLYSSRYAIDVYVDGVFRVTVNAGNGEVDLSAWITTSGWHEIELRSAWLKRISANIFLKTYNRR
jgi:hypothetical protein